MVSIKTAAPRRSSKPTNHFAGGPGLTRRIKLRPNWTMLRPNIMTTPAAAAITDATGIIVSGPKIREDHWETLTHIELS